MADVTVGGGVSVNITNPGLAKEIGNAVQRQVGAHIAGTDEPRYPDGTDSVPSGSGNPGFWNVLYSDVSTDVVLTASDRIDAIVDAGTGNDTLTGGAQTQIIIGNNGNDVINTGRSTTILTGTGDDTLNLSNLTAGNVVDNIYGDDAATINVGAGVDTINLFTIDALVNTTDAGTVVNLRTSSDVTIEGAGASVHGVGNDTISLDASAGPVTVTDKGSATVLGGSDVNGFEFKGGSGNDSVVAGSGATTLIGGSGKEFLQGGSGDLVFHGGTGANTVVAGLGASTLNGGASATSNLYVFDTQAGGVANGTAEIFNWVQGRDSISLGAGEATQSITTSGGGATITLTDGTKIVVHGAFNPTGGIS